MALQQGAGGAEFVEDFGLAEMVGFDHAPFIAGRGGAPKPGVARRRASCAGLRRRHDARSPAMPELAATRLGSTPDTVAPDGTLVRLLPALAGGSLAHFELPAGAVSHAVTHRTRRGNLVFPRRHAARCGDGSGARRASSRSKPASR